MTCGSLLLPYRFQESGFSHTLHRRLILLKGPSCCTCIPFRASRRLNNHRKTGQDKPLTSWPHRSLSTSTSMLVVSLVLTLYASSHFPVLPSFPTDPTNRRRSSSTTFARTSRSMRIWITPKPWSRPRFRVPRAPSPT